MLLANFLACGRTDKARVTVVKPGNENLLRVLRLTKEMLALSDEGDRDRHDDSCGILYGILRDSGYRLKKLAEEERERHRQAGTWDIEPRADRPMD
jgi:hypothetical protein